MGFRIAQTDLEAIRREWTAAGHGEKRAVLDRYADLIGCSYHTLYRRIRVKHGRSKSVTTQKETAYDEAIIDECERIVLRGFHFGERRMSAHRIREKLERRGVPKDQIPSDSTINRRLAERSLEQQQRYRRVEADCALQRVLLDFSRSECFQLVGRKGEDYELRVTAGSYAYKDNNLAHRSWIVSLIDDHSRVGHAKMYPSTGETGMLGLRFLMDTFDTADNEVFPEERIFHHAPWMIQTDHGAFQRSEAVKLALESCEIEFKAASKESQGKVERRFRTMWTDFELVLAEDLGKNKIIALSDYNALLRAWCIEHAQQQHPRLPLTKERVYRASLAEHAPRTLSADLVRMAFSVQERTVDAYGHVRIDNAELVTPDFVSDDEGNQIPVVKGTKVQVLRNLRGEYLARISGVYHPEPFTLTPFQQPAFGDFAHGPQITAHATDLDLAPELPGHEAADLPAYDQPEIPTPAEPEVPSVARVHSIAPRPVLPAQEIVPTNPFTEARHRSLSRFQAIKYVMDRLGHLGLRWPDVESVFGPYVDDATQSTLDSVLDSYQRRAS